MHVSGVSSAGRDSEQHSLPPLNGTFDLVEPDLPLSPPGQYLLRCHPRYPAQCCTAPPAENTDTLVLPFILDQRGRREMGSSP